MPCKVKVFSITATLAAAASLIAGGFVLQIGKPSANPEAQAKNALLIIRGYSCQAPEKTTVSATAEGIVKGKRQAVALKLVALSAQNTYALIRQWPAEGKWVITIVEANPNFDAHPSAIVKVEGNSVDFAGITRLNQAPSKEQVKAALDTTAVASRL